MEQEECHGEAEVYAGVQACGGSTDQGTRRVVGELVVHKIKRPAGIWLGLDEDRRPGSHSATSCSPLAHGETFLPIDPIDAVDTRWFAFLPQQHEQPAVAEALPFIGEFTQMLAQIRIRRPA